MTADQYTDLIEFLAKKFGRIDERFDALEGRMDALEGRMDALEGRMDGLEGRMDGLEGRLTKVEIGLEALRDDVRLLAEGISTTNSRLDRYHQDHETRIRALEAHWFRA